MDVCKSLIALGISAALGVATLGTAVAQTSDREDSVRSWGRWAVLSPAAGGEEYVAFAPAGTNDLERCESGANCPSPKPPRPEPPAAKSPCEAGAPCGFAYIDTLVAGEGAGEESHIGKFELTLTDVENESGNGTEFEVEPAHIGSGSEERAADAAFTITPITSGDVIQSETVRVPLQPDGFGPNRDRSPSLLNGRYTATSEGGDPAIIEGSWRHATATEDGSFTQRGEYVLGVAATAGEMSALFDQLGDGIRGDVIGVYEGPTGRDGSVALMMNFDRATWEGEFAGQAVGFGASGAIVGSGFVSDPAGFSENIASGVVQGGFVNAGQNAIGAFEVTDLEGLHDADIFNAELQIRYED